MKILRESRETEGERQREKILIRYQAFHV